MRFFVAAIAALVAIGSPAMASETEPGFPVYNGTEFQALYEYAVANTLPNLDQPNGQGPITGDRALDARIWEMAFARGYQMRPSANGGIVTVDGVPMQEQAAEAWLALKAEARAAGHSFIVSSAYRSLSAQRAHFLSKLTGSSEAAIGQALTWYSVPGTSKHHAGYALDFRYRDGTFGSFRETPDYAWLSANNFAIPKKYGFIPSYPDDVENQGPNPEPWEFVWVGPDLVRCGIPVDISEVRYATGHRHWLAEEITSCPGSVTAADLDYMLKNWGRKVEAMLKA